MSLSSIIKIMIIIIRRKENDKLKSNNKIREHFIPDFTPVNEKKTNKFETVTTLTITTRVETFTILF